MYLVLSAFTSSPIFLAATGSVYLNCYYGSLFRFYPLSVIWNTTFWTHSLT